MNKTIDEQLQEALRKNLPAVQAQYLSEYIDDAEKIKIEFEKSKKSFYNLEVEFEILNKKYQELVNLKNQKETIDMERANLTQDMMKFHFDKKVSENDNKHEKEKVSLVKEMFTTVFRNTTLRKTVISDVNKNDSEYDNNNCNHNKNSNSLITTNETVEKTEK